MKIRPKVIEYIQQNPKITYVDGDATQDITLQKAGVERAKALITALADDADNLFVVITAREMNPNLKIISRASAILNDKKLKLAGANNVILPDQVGGQKMAKLVIQPDILEFVENIMLKRVGNITLQRSPVKNYTLVMQKQSEIGIRKKQALILLALENPLANTS